MKVALLEYRNFGISATTPNINPMQCIFAMRFDSGGGHCIDRSLRLDPDADDSLIQPCGEVTDQLTETTMVVLVTNDFKAKLSVGLATWLAPAARRRHEVHS